MTRIAIAQLRIAEGDVDANVARSHDAIAVAAEDGAELVVLPECALTGVPTRAIENRVFVAVADRTGDVDDVVHLGASQIVDPTGARLTTPLDPERDVAVATVDVNVTAARAKTTVFAPGAFEIDVFGDRRPELYRVLTQEQFDA